MSFNAIDKLNSIKKLKNEIAKEGIKISGKIYVKFGTCGCDCVCTRLAITMGPNVRMCVADSILDENGTYFFPIDHTFNVIDPKENYSTELNLPIEDDTLKMFDCVYLRLFCTVYDDDKSEKVMDRRDIHVLHLGTKCVPLDQLCSSSKITVKHNYTETAFSQVKFDFPEDQNKSLNRACELQKIMHESLEHFSTMTNIDKLVIGFHNCNFMQKVQDPTCRELWNELDNGVFRLSHCKFLEDILNATRIQCATMIDDFKKNLVMDKIEIHKSYRNMMTYLQPQDFSFCFTDMTDVIKGRFAILPLKLLMSFLYGGLWRFHDPGFLDRISNSQRETLHENDFNNIVISWITVLNMPMYDSKEAGYFSDYVPKGKELGSKINKDCKPVVRKENVTEKFVELALTDDNKHLYKGTAFTCYQTLGDDCENAAIEMLTIYCNLILLKSKFIGQGWYKEKDGKLSNKILTTLVNKKSKNELVGEIIGVDNREVVEMFDGSYDTMFQVLLSLANIMRLIEMDVKLCYGTSGNPSFDPQSAPSGEGGHCYAINEAKCGFYQRRDVLEGTAWINTCYDSSTSEGRKNLKNPKKIAAVVKKLNLECQSCRGAAAQRTEKEGQNFYRYCFAMGSEILISMERTDQQGVCSNKLGVSIEGLLDGRGIRYIKNTYRSLAQGTDNQLVHSLMYFARNRILVEEDMPLWTRNDWQYHLQPPGENQWKCKKVEGVEFHKDVGKNAFFIETVHPYSIIGKLKTFKTEDSVFIFDAFHVQGKILVIWVRDSNE